jgi:signal transduction histidine kinase
LEDPEGRLTTMTAQAPEHGAAPDREGGHDPLSAPPERHAWDVGLWWDLYFTGTMLAMTVLALLTGPERWRWATAGLMLAVIVLHYALVRRYFKTGGDEPSWVGPFPVALLLLLPTLPAVILNPLLTFLLVALSPLAFMTLGSMLAVSTVGMILLVPNLWSALAGDEAWEDVGLSLLINVTMLAFAFWFGSWFERIVEQSYERYSLIEQLQHSREEATRLSEQAGAMAERERLAREMHDTLAQGFTSIITLTQAVESEMDTDPDTARRHLVLMRETAAENLAEARAMVAARQAVGVEGGDLNAALNRICERLGRELDIEVTPTVTGTPEELPNDLQVCLLRTAQEALANVRKHADADRSRVCLAYTDVGVSLSVTDNGRGFDTSLPGHGNGLANMRHRAESFGGTLDLESVPGQGTTVRLTIPSEETSTS